MKLNKLVCLVAAVAAAMSLSTAVYAADNTITMGAPIDLETNSVAEDLKSGDIIAVPVDVTSTTGKLTSFSAVIEYDTEYLEASIDVDDVNLVSDTVYNNMITLSGESTGANFTKSVVNKVGSIKQMYTTGRGGAKTYVGTMVYNPNYSAVSGYNNFAYTSWTHTASVETSDTPETYFIFRVTKDIDVDKLNLEIFNSSNYEGNLVQDNLNGLPAVTNINADASQSKANACYGAFNINIDSSVLPYWVQGLYVSVNGGAKVAVSEYKTTDNVTYTFPVRVTTNSTNATTATVEVFADTSSDESGTADVQSAVSMGTFDIQLNSPSSYADNIVTAQ